MIKPEMKPPWPPERPLKTGDTVIVVATDSTGGGVYPGDIAVLLERRNCGCWKARFTGVFLPNGMPAGNKSTSSGTFIGTGVDGKRCPSDGGTKIRKVPWQ